LRKELRSPRWAFEITGVIPSEYNISRRGPIQFGLEIQKNMVQYFLYDMDKVEKAIDEKACLSHLRPSVSTPRATPL